MHIIIQNRDIMRGSSTVTDEAGNELYYVKGKLKIASPTRKKFIKDKDGNVIYTVRDRWFNFFFNGAIIKDAEGNVMKLKNKMSFKNPFYLEGAGDSYFMGRDPQRRGAAIFKNDEVIAVYNKKGTGLIHDRYNVDCLNENEIPVIVMLIIALDNIRDKNTRDIYND